MANFSLRGTLEGHNGAVTCIVTNPNDPHTLISGSRDKTIMVWRVTRDESDYGAPQKSLIGHNYFVQDLALSGDGMFLISASWDKTLRLWDLANGSSTIFSGHEKDVLSVAFSPNNRQISSGSRDSSIKLWNCLGDIKYSISQDNEGHSEWVSCVRFSPDASRPLLISSSWDKSIKVWDMNKFTLAAKLTGHNGYISKLAVSPDGTICASGGKDGVVMLWDLVQYGHLFTLNVNSEIYDLAFCPSQTWLAVACGSSIHIWDATKREHVDIINVDSTFGNSRKALPMQSLSLVWSGDGSTLFSGHSDNIIRVWTYTSTL